MTSKGQPQHAITFESIMPTLSPIPGKATQQERIRLMQVREKFSRRFRN